MKTVTRNQTGLAATLFLAAALVLWLMTNLVHNQQRCEKETIQTISLIKLI